MRRVLAVMALCSLMAGAVSAFQQSLQRDADSLQRKLALLLERGAKPQPRTTRPFRTLVSEREVNAYFRVQGREFLPVGVVNPNVSILDASRVEAKAIVDLDAVRTSRERVWTDPLSWVSGTVEVRAMGRLRAANGVGTFQLESATLGGVPIPKALLQELVAYYSRTPESPRGFDFDQPFTLPHQIRQVELQRGAAVIVQ